LLHRVGRNYTTLLLNRELVSRVKLCLLNCLTHIVKHYPKMRNLPKIFLRSFENVAPDYLIRLILLARINALHLHAL